MVELNFKFSRNRFSDNLPTWEEVVMLNVLFFTWWLVNKIFPELKTGKLIGVFASLASFAVIVWISVIKSRRKTRRANNQYTRRIDALKEDGIPITHTNIYNKSIRPDFPIDD